MCDVRAGLYRNRAEPHTQAEQRGQQWTEWSMRFTKCSYATPSNRFVRQCVWLCFRTLLPWNFQIILFYFWIIALFHLSHSSTSLTPAHLTTAALSLWPVELGRGELTLNAVFTNSNLQILHSMPLRTICVEFPQLLYLPFVARVP